MYTSVIVHEVSVPRLMWMLKAGPFSFAPLHSFFCTAFVSGRGLVVGSVSSPLLTRPSSLKVGFPEFSWLLLRCSPRPRNPPSVGPLGDGRHGGWSGCGPWLSQTRARFRLCRSSPSVVQRSMANPFVFSPRVGKEAANCLIHKSCF